MTKSNLLHSPLLYHTLGSHVRSMITKYFNFQALSMCFLHFENVFLIPFCTRVPTKHCANMCLSFSQVLLFLTQELGPLLLALYPIPPDQY